jgi:hypothetical protein
VDEDARLSGGRAAGSGGVNRFSRAMELDREAQRIRKVLNGFNRQAAPTMHESRERLWMDAGLAADCGVRPGIFSDGFSEVGKQGHEIHDAAMVAS